MPPALRTASRAVDSEDVLGGVALRDSEFIKTAGHIDYGIRPSARRPSARDVGSTGAAQHVRLLGIEHVLLVCAADNEASARMIERTGGVLESIQPTEHGPAPPEPEDAVISVLTDDIDGAYDKAQRLRYEIVYPITTEPWGHRRFFVRPPDGNLINIGYHPD